MGIGLSISRDVLFEYHEQLFLIVEQLDQLEVCQPYGRLLIGIQIKHLYPIFVWFFEPLKNTSKKIIEHSDCCTLQLRPHSLHSTAQYSTVHYSTVTAVSRG